MNLIISWRVQECSFRYHISLFQGVFKISVIVISEYESDEEESHHFKASPRMQLCIFFLNISRCVQDCRYSDPYARKCWCAFEIAVMAIPIIESVDVSLYFKATPRMLFWIYSLIILRLVHDCIYGDSYHRKCWRWISLFQGASENAILDITFHSFKACSRLHLWRFLS